MQKQGIKSPCDNIIVATDHPLYGPGGGTESNELSTPADLSVTSLEDCIIEMKDTRNNRGLRMNMKPRHLIVSTTNMFVADKILKSEQEAYTANNQRNAFKSVDLSYMVVDYLTSEQAFFLAADKKQHALKWFWRRKPDFGQDNIFTTEDRVFKSTFRIGWGWGDWRGLFASAGA